MYAKMAAIIFHVYFYLGEFLRNNLSSISIVMQKI